MGDNLLLDDAEGWMLSCLEDGLIQDQAWEKLAKVVTTASGASLYSVGDICHLNTCSKPSATLVRQLVQRGVSVNNLLKFLHLAKLHELHSLLAPHAPACIEHQSVSGCVSVPYGGTLSVMLEVSGNPSPSFVWYKGDDPLMNHQTDTLALKHCSEQHDGVYLCLVRQRRPMALNEDIGEEESHDAPEYVELWSSPVEVQVVHTDAPSPLHPQPRHTITHAAKVISSDAKDEVPVVVRQPSVPTAGNADGTGCPAWYRGQPVQLWCSVRCSRAVEFTWVKNGAPLVGHSGPDHVVLWMREGGGGIGGGGSGVGGDLSYNGSNNNSSSSNFTALKPASDVHNSSLLYTPSDGDSQMLRLLCIASTEIGKVYSEEVLIKLKAFDMCQQVYTARNKWALLVGNRRYAARQLHAALLDCQRLAGALSGHGYRCLVLSDLSLTHFRNAVTLMESYVQEGDYVVFYYAGHGYHSQGDRMIPVDGSATADDALLAGGCISPVWVRNRLVRRRPAMLLMVLDMCRTKLSRSPSSPHHTVPSAVLPVAARCSVVLHATAVSWAALEAPNSSSVLTRHLLKRMHTHAGQPVTRLAAAVMQDVCGDSDCVRQRQYPTLEVDLAAQRCLADTSTAPAGPLLDRWEAMVGLGGPVSTRLLIPRVTPQTRDTGGADDTLAIAATSVAELLEKSTDSASFDKSAANVQLHETNEIGERVFSARETGANQEQQQHQQHVVNIRAVASVIPGHHPVSNIALVEVRITAAFALQQRTSVIALGCRVLPGRMQRQNTKHEFTALSVVYIVEDLHCLKAPMVVAVSVTAEGEHPPAGVSSTATPAAGVRGHQRHDRSGNPCPQLSNVKPVDKADITANDLKGYQQNNSNNGNHRADRGTEQLSSCTKTNVNNDANNNERQGSVTNGAIWHEARLSLGYPGIAKTNLHQNDLRGANTDHEEDLDCVGPQVQKLNIAL